MSMALQTRVKELEQEHERLAEQLHEHQRSLLDRIDKIEMRWDHRSAELLPLPRLRPDQVPKPPFRYYQLDIVGR